jgi:hypothetical protein
MVMDEVVLVNLGMHKNFIGGIVFKNEIRLVLPVD